MAKLTVRQTIEAVHWTGDNLDEVKAFLGDAYRDSQREIHALRDAKDDPTGRQRTDGLMKPTGEMEWLGVAYEVPPVWYGVEVGQWIVATDDEPSGFLRLDDDDFHARYGSVK